MSQGSQQHIRVRVANGVAVIGFTASYLQTEEAIREAGEQLLNLVDKKSHTRFLISFQGVRFVSSSMLGQIVLLQKKVAKQKGQVKLCGLGPEMRELLRVSQLDRLLEVHEDETAALAKF